jgi:hypothetical protein
MGWNGNGRATATRRSNDHLAERCRDDDCPRLPCRMFKAGYRKGYDDGYAKGWMDGEAAGYSAGFAAGAASAVTAGRVVMLAADHVLIGFAILVLWLASLYARPFGRCPRCRGRRVVTRKNARGRVRSRTCWLCKGIGRRQLTGSRTVHRAVRFLRHYHRTRRES